MPTFDFPMLAWWGLPLAAAPLVIHLITRLRHARVPFAALEFLVASRRRHRARVLLREWLLLAVRTAAIVGVVAALARPRWDGGGRLAAGPTFHLVILDDSYSMGDRAGDGLAAGTAFDRGRRAAERIAADLADAGDAADLAILRGSRCGADGSPPSAWDVPRRTVGPEAARKVRDELAAAVPSAMATGPGPALTAAADLVASGSTGPAVVWFVSDFRARDWTAPTDAKTALDRLTAAGVGIRFVDCGPPPAPAADGNLTLEAIRMVGGVPAAGVLVPLELNVRNDGPGTARDVQVTLREDGGTRPGVGIPEIPPGGTATARFEARFPAAGDHVVAATLPGDRLPADDARSIVIDVRDVAEVLLIDGDPRGSGRAGDALYVATALAPGPGAPTGLRPRVEPPRALAELDLTAFDSIWLLDVERLDPREIDPLEAFARAGGGVVFFVGPRTRPEEYNRRLHRAGAGIFPVSLAEPSDLVALPAGGARQPDVRVEDHPVVAVLAGQRNPLLDAVRIERFMAVDEEAGPAPRRLLSLRTGPPLAVERPAGAGLVVAMLTTAAPTWNNWARGNPSWVVTLLELEGHVSRARRQPRSVAVGEPVAVRLDAAVDGAEVEFTVPPADAVVRVAAAADAGHAALAVLPRADAPGVGVARWRGVDGGPRERLFAVNVDPAEGRLSTIDRDGLARAVGGVPFTFARAESPTPLAPPPAGAEWTRPLAVGLLILLLAEQVLAERAGDHPAARPGRGRHAAAPT
jgi:hypothetical protein